MSIGDFPESLSQAMLVGIMLVGRLGVCLCSKRNTGAPRRLEGLVEPLLGLGNNNIINNHNSSSMSRDFGILSHPSAFPDI